MAQGDKWRIGVGVQIPNHSFRFPTTWGSTLSANYTTGTRLYITDTSPDFDKVLKVGDKITVGPSSHSGHEGSVETREITAIEVATPPTYVDVDLAFTYDYSSGDTVFALGHNLCGGATLYGTEMDFSGIDHGIGCDDDWSQKIDASATGDNHMMLSLNIKPLASQVYRYGMWYKASSVSGSCRQVFYDGVTWHVNSISTQVSFVELTKIVTTNASPTSEAKLTFNMTGTASVANLYLDCFYLQHAKGSSGEANGYYEFSEIPDRGIKPLREDGKIKRRLPSGALRQYDPSGFGERSVKYGLKATFSNVSQTFWDQLQIFQKWQDRGNLLNLFPFIDDLPPFLQGVMEIKEWDKSGHWDLGRRTFDLIFREA